MVRAIPPRPSQARSTWRSASRLQVPRCARGRSLLVGPAGSAARPGGVLVGSVDGAVRTPHPRQLPARVRVGLAAARRIRLGDFVWRNVPQATLGGGRPLETVMLLAVLAAVAAAFTVSASAGFGGSLILVPALGLLLGTKSGTALAALLLAANNVVKVWAYRKTIPWRRAALLTIIIAVGTALGAILFVAAPEDTV